jgi:hypothetical protein
MRRKLTPPRLRSPSPPPRTGSPLPSGSSDKQSDESELSAQEGSFEDEQERELDVRESAQCILGEQRLIESWRLSAPSKETCPQRVLPGWRATIIQYRKQLEDAKEKERKLQELLRTRERDITQLRSLRTDSFEGPPTFYEETILHLNNQLQMLRRDTADHSEEKKLMEGRERGNAELMKEKNCMHQRAIDVYSDLHKRSSAKLKDGTESQLRNQLQEVTEELQTSRQAVAEKVDELNQLRVLLREEAELYGDDYERRRTSSAQDQRITEYRTDHGTMRMIYLPSRMR